MADRTLTSRAPPCAGRERTVRKGDDAAGSTRLAWRAGRANAGPAVQRLTALSDATNDALPGDAGRAGGLAAATGLPARLRSGIEALSGHPMHAVRVHRDSCRPALLQAHAYTQGDDIYLAPGQAHHLPHEAWHVVQQRDGRVRPTTGVAGIALNDDPGLEREADRMGDRAAAAIPRGATAAEDAIQRRPVDHPPTTRVVQRVTDEATRAVMEELAGVLKRFEARLATSAAEDVIDTSPDRLRLVVATARTRLDALMAGGRVRAADGAMSFGFDDGTPIYIHADTLHARDTFFGDLTANEQAGLLLQVLVPEMSDGEATDLLAATRHGLAPAEDGEVTLRKGASVYRGLKAETARSYILAGIKTVTNAWAALGSGLYTSPDREGAEAYVGNNRPVTVIEFVLKQAADGKIVGEEFDEKSEAYIAKKIGKFEFLTDDALSEIKFHRDFYTSHLEVKAVFVQDETEQWVTYQPSAFVAAFEQLRIDQHKRKARAIPRPEEIKPGPQHIGQVKDPTPALREARTVPTETKAAIAYVEAAMAFEAQLGRALARHPDVVGEVAKLLRAAWDAKQKQAAKFGYGGTERSGAVGAELPVLESVVANGNLREQLTMIYNGYTARVWDDLERPPALSDAARQERLDVPKADRSKAPHPESVTPPLSDREWFSSVDGKGQLSWTTGAMRFHHKMASTFQQEAETLLAPVGTGLSGTSYGILQIASRYGMNLQLIRLALLGWMLPAGDHSFHEIMAACAIFSSDTLPYDESDPRRYRSLPPLSEGDLRAMAPAGMFPDEVAAEARAIDLMLDAVEQARKGKSVGAGNLYIAAAAALRREDWRNAELVALDEQLDALLRDRV